MGLTEWSDAFVVGIPVIDEGHRQIFDLDVSFSGSGDQIRVMKSLAMLCNYVKVHFREEEALMAASAYPGLAEHLQQHAWFREALFALLERAKIVSLDQLADEMHRLTNEWLHQHVLAIDAEYLRCLRSLVATA